MRFKNNEATVCGQSHSSKKEQKIQIEHNLKSAKARKVGYKRDLKALKRMYNKGYSYNHLKDIIGSCYIEIDRAKGDIEEYQEQLLKIETKGIIA